ncbi:MAG TPA: FG-GAP-like repeat-containing protein [Chryseolinea sp.]
MKRISPSIFRAICFFTFVISTVFVSKAQKPEINSIDKRSGHMEEVVTIKGAFFGTDATKIAVTFGASKGQIVSITDQIIEVKVPTGTTYNNISITNLTTGLTGYSDNPFLLNFNGSAGFDLSNLQGQFNFPAGAPVSEGLYDICMCDFDGDKKVDVATASDNYKFINIYPNGSTIGTIAFPSKIAVNIASLSLHIKCGDLNGDGKPDLIATESGTTDKVFILKNGSTGVGNFTFSPPSTVSLPGKRPKRIEIADLDLDGKPEVLITSQGSNTVTALVNQSTLANILFSPAPPVEIFVPGAVSTEGLAVADLNGDGLSDIVTSQFQTNSNLYVIENKSSPGSVLTGDIKTLTVGTPIKNIRIGDLDGDGKADIAFTQLISTSIGTFLNQSTTSLAFGSLKVFETDITPWGLDFGDIDGDGKIDIAAASLTKKSLTILNNKSTPGNLAFDKMIQPTTYINRHIAVGDVDTDGKPDIVFTSIDDNNLNVPASKVSVFRNKHCMVPKITPAGPLHICAGLPLVLKATIGGGATYEWTNTTTNTTVAGSAEYTPTVSGDYLVKAISESNNCNEISNTVKVTISPGTAGDPLPVNDGPVCVGQTLNLEISNDLGPGFTYEWSGPDNYTGSGTNPAPVTNFRLINAGRYYVDVKAASGCVARRESTLVEAIDMPEFKVGFTGSDVICSGNLKQLNVVPNAPGFTYQWYEKTSGIIAGATSATHTIGASGEYYYTATSTTPTCSSVTSSSAKLNVVTLPVVAFSMPTSACKGSEVSFTNQTTFDAQAVPVYSWNFGDGGVSSEKDPKHIYSSTGSFSVKLTVSYTGNACPTTVTNPPITITDAPAAVITTDLNKSEICPDETLVLLVSGTFTSYLWSTGATTPTLPIQAGGDYGVTVKATNGCELKATTTITDLPSPEITVSATPEIIDEGQSVQLEASGMQTYTWTPADNLSDPNIPNPVGIPLTSTSYSVSGKDNNNCVGTASISVTVRGEAIVKKLKPENFFSPNDDPINPYWKVDKIDEYPQCEVAVYDDKGVKVFGAKPYMNDWDGSFNGTRLPDGVYYYIIRCEGEQSVPSSGSITLLR